MRYHEDIFYPSSKEELIGLLEPIGVNDEHKAFIVPHMALGYIAHLYRAVFSSIPDGMRIIGLFPLHREPLLCDENEILFSSEERDEEMAIGTVHIRSLGFPSASAYEEEEYSMELLLPYIAHHNPSSLFYPIFCNVKKSEDMKKLAQKLTEYDDGNTAFIISSNMTDRIDKGVEEEREKAINMVLSGNHLMDAWRKGRFRACGAPLIEAARRAFGGHWQLIGVSDKETKAGHAAFFMDERSN